MTDIPKPLLAYLEKRGYVEQSPAGWFILDTGSVEIVVDLRGDAPKVGRLESNGQITEEGHGLTRIDDVRNEVMHLWNKRAGNRPAEGTKEPGKKKEEEPAPSENQWKCSNCGNPVDMKQADDTASKYLSVFCKDCEPIFDQPKPAPKEADVVAPHVPARISKDDIEGHRAKENFMRSVRGDNTQNLPAKYERRELVVGTCEAVAIQYGIPTELANLFFMKMNEGLYIKNPGLLYLAGKKGYSRIEITDKYDEKSGEWSAECRIYPKVTKADLEGISKLDKEMQKQAFDFLTNPTNGTGRASKNNVKMSTMQVFLREMAQTRAQNRALRAFTGYGGTSAEELPEGQMEVN